MTQCRHDCDKKRVFGILKDMHCIRSNAKFTSRLCDAALNVPFGLVFAYFNKRPKRCIGTSIKCLPIVNCPHVIGNEGDPPPQAAIL